MASLSLATIAIALSIGVASGTIGSFVILQRLALVGDALSHVALPGIALALAYGIDPFWGVLVFLLGASTLVWWLEQRSAVSTDTIVGILFTTALAVGILTIPDTEILESLFGAFPTLTPVALALLLIVAVSSTIATLLLTRRFLFATIAPDVARVDGIHTGTRLILLVLFAIVVALGIKLVGTLLMGALTIIPAAIARNIARSARASLLLAAILGGVIATGGVSIAARFAILPGPAIILFGIACFAGSLAVRGVRGAHARTH